MSRLEQLRHWGFPVLLIIIVTLGVSLLRSVLTLANFTAIYLLLVLLLAIRRGTWVALASAVVSFLCINYFLIAPYYTFAIADPREVIDLLIFLGVAVLAGQLAARLREQTDAAEQRAFEQEVLYRLTRSFNQLATSESVYDALVTTLQTDLAARQAYVLPYASEMLSPDMTVHYVVLEAGGKVYGTLCAGFDTHLTREKVRLINACAAQAALALNRVELIEQVRQSQQFEEADRLKTAILHAVSHDLRTPITIIKTSANNLHTLGERLSPSDRAELSEAIEQESDQLDRMVGNLLDMSRLRAGALNLNSAPNSLEEVAGDAAANVYKRLKLERIRLSFSDDLPRERFDYGLILQALTNLVDNALRYEPPASQIELRGEQAGETVRLLVVNHGENIAPDERERIMEPFFHGKNGQVGLGLAIAKGIVEAHHGSLTLEDTPGGGATFVIALPFELEKEKAHDAQNSGGG